MTHQDVADGLAVDPFDIKVTRTQGDWSVEWDHEGLIAGQATFTEVEDGVLWTRFNVLDTFRGRGLYTQALRFSTDHGRAHIAADTAARDFYLSAGFQEKDGLLVQDKRRSASWLKGR